MLWLMSSNPILRQKSAPTLADADRVVDEYVANYLKTGDANDMLYALEASRDYDPGPGLEKITAPLLAVNSADDLINPPELGILEREIARVRERTRDRHPAQRQDRRPRHAHPGRGVESSTSKSCCATPSADDAGRRLPVDERRLPAVRAQLHRDAPFTIGLPAVDHHVGAGDGC